MNAVTPFRVGLHPFLRNRWTHLVDVQDCRARGWFMLTASGEVAFGAWKTRAAAIQAGRRLTKRERTFRMIRRVA